MGSKIPAGGSLLSSLAGLSRLAPVQIYIGSAMVPAGGTVVFCKTNLGNAGEASVVGLDFYWDALDLKTSPISLVAFSGQSSGSTLSSTNVLQDPFTDVLTHNGSPFWLPSPYGIALPRGSGAGLQIKNNEVLPYFVRGMIAVVAWSDDGRTQIEEAQAQAGGPSFVRGF